MGANKANRQLILQTIQWHLQKLESSCQKKKINKPKIQSSPRNQRQNILAKSKYH